VEMLDTDLFQRLQPYDMETDLNTTYSINTLSGHQSQPQDEEGGDQKNEVVELEPDNATSMG
jgi:hypothetical protein